MLITDLKETKPKTYNAVGSMHKYWGKKPHNVISKLIELFTKEGDSILDPFMGSGVTVVEALATNRKAFGVDLNPFSCLLTKVSITPVDIQKFKDEGYNVIAKTLSEIKDIYKYSCDCGSDAIMVSAVRSNSNEINRIKIDCSSCGKLEREVTENDILATNKQDSFKTKHFYPKQNLILNSRINAKKGMTIADLFTKRNLFVCASLLNNIKQVEDQGIREALLITFTANLPNSSRLTPIIKQRGLMSPGAWMTGFYIGKDFLEQNVLWYFENRLKKTIRAKQEILDRNLSPALANLFNSNAEQLSNIKTNSIDFVFTDPPYGDTVPYFEQSLLYNSWLNFDVNYGQEIVISDSKERTKTEKDYVERLSKSFQEMHRVLKPGKDMVLTFHKMDGTVWHNFVKVIIQAGFKLKDVIPLYQKTSTPRQLNRVKSIKCDMILAFESVQKQKVNILTYDEAEEIIIASLIDLENFSTDEAFSIILTNVYMKGLPEKELNISKILTENFVHGSNGWRALSI